ncbi:hypothetical protein ACFQ1I_41025 [Kitasatospora arboriphila]
MTTRHLLPPSPAHGGAVPLLLTTVTDVPGPAGASSISTARSTGAARRPGERARRSPTAGSDGCWRSPAPTTSSPSAAASGPP